MRRLLLLAALAVLGSQLARAQQAPAWALKATPQHLVLSGYWLEAERTQPSHPGYTLTLAPQLYWGPTGHPDSPRQPLGPASPSTVRGGGLQVQPRLYLRAAADGFPTGFYLGLAPQVQVFRLRYERITWHEEPSSIYGLPLLVLGPVPAAETVLRYGVVAQLGYQWQLSGRVLLDVYAGVGVRQSRVWTADGASQFTSGPSDYAHEGVYVPAGLKLGVVL